MVLCSKGMEQLLGGGAESEEDASRTVFFSPFRFCSSVVLHFACSIEASKAKKQKESVLHALPALSLSFHPLSLSTRARRACQPDTAMVRFPSSFRAHTESERGDRRVFFSLQGHRFSVCPPSFLLAHVLTHTTHSFLLLDTLLALLSHQHNSLSRTGTSR